MSKQYTLAEALELLGHGDMIPVRRDTTWFILRWLTGPAQIIDGLTKTLTLGQYSTPSHLIPKYRLYPTLTELAEEKHQEYIDTLRGIYNCKDCKIHTGKAEEYYMVTDSIWNQYGARSGMLCIGCLEKRMGRQLTPNDFPEAIINDPNCGRRMSQRLKNRITGD